MSRTKTLLIVVLLLSYGAVGARQPAVRGAAPLPAPAKTIAASVGIPSADTSTLLLDITRLLYDGTDFDSPRVRRLRDALRDVTAAGDRWKTKEDVPLPLDPSVWRDTLLQRQVPDEGLVAAIVGDRGASLLYHGLFALDDETLAWLGADRETLLQLREHPGTFAVFGRSVHVRAGRVLVPGGETAIPLWEDIVGASPSKPSAFVQHLFKDDRAAFFYDTIAHLDPAHQRFALGLQLPDSLRKDRFRALFDVFVATSPTWRPEAQPFLRPLLDPGLVLATISVNEAGAPTGPMSRRLWDRVLRADGNLDMVFGEIEALDVATADGALASDAAGLAGRVVHAPNIIGRRRLDAMLFAQRVFGNRRADEPAVATALRGFIAYPALMLTLERIGIREPDVFVRAAERASALSAMRLEPSKRAAMTQFQAALGIVERIRRTGLLDIESAQLLALSLFKIDLSSERGYEGRLAQWLRTTLVQALPPAAGAATAPIEDTVLSAMAGVGPSRPDLPVVEWEGARYRVDPSRAELARLRRVRHEQDGVSLDAALIATPTASSGLTRARPTPSAAAGEQVLGDALASILYAAYLGDPSGVGVTSGNVALRHYLAPPALAGTARPGGAWRLPGEDFSGSIGWHVRGSLLGLDAALGRLGLRRIDPTSMPEEPNLGLHQRAAFSVMAALFNPFAMTDAARDEIAAALGRGRARVAALTPNDTDLDRVAREAGLSEWRRTALGWTVGHNHEAAAEQFSLLELFWLGAPRAGAARSLDAWGAVMLPLTGCLCLEMPRPQPWEDLAGRRGSGIMVARAADVALRVADVLSTLRLPASLAPGVLAFALQDVTDHVQLAYPEDWQAFGRAARDLPLSRLTDYIAALSADGPLVPLDSGH